MLEVLYPGLSDLAFSDPANYLEKHLKTDLKEACIGYGALNTVSLPGNHQTRLSVSRLGFPVGMPSASTETGCGSLATVLSHLRYPGASRDLVAPVSVARGIGKW